MAKEKIWSKLRAIAKRPPTDSQEEMESLMAIAALTAVYRHLLEKNGSVDNVDKKTSSTSTNDG